MTQDIIPVDDLVLPVAPVTEHLEEITIGEGIKSILFKSISDFKPNNRWSKLSAISTNLFSQLTAIEIVASGLPYASQGLYQAIVSTDKLWQYSNKSFSSITLDTKLRLYSIILSKKTSFM